MSDETTRRGQADAVEADHTVPGDMQELEFSGLSEQEAIAAEDRLYLVGVHADRHRIID